MHIPDIVIGDHIALIIGSILIGVGTGSWCVGLGVWLVGIALYKPV